MFCIIKKTLENTEGSIQIDNLEKLAQDEDKQNNNTICVGHQHTQTTTNNWKMGIGDGHMYLQNVVVLYSHTRQYIHDLPS